MNDKTPLPLGHPPMPPPALPGQPTPSGVLDEVARAAAALYCINPGAKLIFDCYGRVENRLYLRN